MLGDELLSGKRQDKHLPKVIALLAARGLGLDWAQFLGDDEAMIAAAIVASRERGDLVLSCGGIGATPDDCTRQAAARAFGVPLVRHPEAAALIEARYREQALPNRVLMADFPEGAGLIPNPVNQVAGFFVGDHNFVPGFPEMAWPMLEWVMDSRYPQLRNATPPVEFILRALGNAAESDLLELMQSTLVAHPGLKLSSLPFRGNDTTKAYIEFGFKGPYAMATSAYMAFASALLLRGIPMQQIKAPN